MNRHSYGCIARATLIAAAVAFATGSSAQAGSSSDATYIAVFNDHYRSADRDFEDLTDLQSSMGVEVRALNLLVCGDSPTRALKAIVHRFRQLPVQMRAPAPDDIECLAGAVAPRVVRTGLGRRPLGIDDAALERYWQDIMP